MAIPTAFFNHDVKKLEFLLSEIEDEIRRSGKFKKHRFNKWKIEAIIKQLEPSYDFSNKNICLLSRYLKNLKKWGLYDIYLFGYCASIFDLKDLKKLTAQMLAYMQSTNHLYKIEHAVIQSALKVITSCLAGKEFDLARNYINQLKHLKIHDYHMYDKFTLTYLEASLDYQAGKTSALETLEKCQEMALFLRLSRHREFYLT